MNKIIFNIQHSEFGNLVVPFIDGKSLISILKEFELPFAKKEKHPKIAGGYDGLPISLVRSPSQYYYGKTENRRLDGKTPILICQCLCAGCWDFVVEIEANDKKVIWKNFEQIHRRNWNYNELGSFTFNRKQFEIALNELENK